MSNLLGHKCYHVRLYSVRCDLRRLVCLLLRSSALFESWLSSILALMVSQVTLNALYILFAEQWCQCRSHPEASFRLQDC
jgi:hypothetical protein